MAVFGDGLDTSYQGASGETECETSLEAEGSEGWLKMSPVLMPRHVLEKVLLWSEEPKERVVGDDPLVIF